MMARLEGGFSKPGARARRLLYSWPAMTSVRRATLFLTVAALLSMGTTSAHAQRRRRPAQRPRPTPTATPGPRPTATPIPFYRAAGFCLRYEKDHFLVLAELGQAGRVFHIDRDTIVAAKVTTGARLRILYVETPDGPVAKRILPGPADPPPTPK
jgi:hypothetical protein